MQEWSCKESPHVREVHTKTVGAGVLDFGLSHWDSIHGFSPLNSKDVFQRRFSRVSLRSFISRLVLVDKSDYKRGVPSFLAAVTVFFSLVTALCC